MRWVEPVERSGRNDDRNVKEEDPLGAYVFILLKEIGFEDVATLMCLRMEPCAGF